MRKHSFYSIGRTTQNIKSRRGLTAPDIMIYILVTAVTVIPVTVTVVTKNGVRNAAIL
jgi:hypothetical protein